MRKKLFSFSVAVVFAVVGFASLSGMASAAEFGNCLTPLAGSHPPCPVGKAFTPFPAATTTGVVTTKAAATAEFALQNEATPANGISCPKLSGQGILGNGFGPNGIIEETLVFEGCKGVGVLAFCQIVVRGTAQKINGTGKIEGEITAEAITGTEQEITLNNGFLVTCTNGLETVDLGDVSGVIKGEVLPALPYELSFTNAKGVVFAGEPSTLTGTSTTKEAYGLGKIYQR